MKGMDMPDHNAVEPEVEETETVAPVEDAPTETQEPTVEEAGVDPIEATDGGEPGHGDGPKE